MVVVILVTTGTSVGRIVVVTIMTGDTLIRDSHMSSCYNIILVVDIKRGWAPTRFRRVAGSACGGHVEGLMIRIG